MTHPHLSSKFGVKQGITFVVLMFGLYFLIPQLHVFKESLHQLNHVHYGMVALAFCAVVITFILGALVYCILAFKKIGYKKTLLVQIAANFINRLLPAGVGGIGANYRYLRNQKHTAAQAASVVAANNGLGLAGHGVILAVLVTTFHGRLTPIHIKNNLLLIFLGIMLGAIALAISISGLRRRLVRGLQSFSTQFVRFKVRPYSLVSALLVQLSLTLSNITAFWLCAQSLHVGISFVAALLIFTLGFGVGNALPLPGGLGGVEAGLVAGLVAYNYTSASSLAVVLVYRLVSYWLPLLISAPVFAYTARRHYF